LTQPFLRRPLPSLMAQLVRIPFVYPALFAGDYGQAFARCGRGGPQGWVVVWLFWPLSVVRDFNGGPHSERWYLYDRQKRAKRAKKVTSCRGFSQIPPQFRRMLKERIWYHSIFTPSGG
jgi:hypothetical protein